MTHIKVFADPMFDGKEDPRDVLIGRHVGLGRRSGVGGGVRQTVGPWDGEVCPIGHAPCRREGGASRERVGEDLCNGNDIISNDIIVKR